MRVLVLGGTHFLGRHVVETLLERGHHATLFHRGETGADLFPDVERVLGDRTRDLDRLPSGARWDAVVDTSAYVPGTVAASAGALRDRAGQYVFVSSVSVFDIAQPAIDESSAMLALPEHASREEMVPETYGPLKRLCELEAVAAFGAERTLVVRPGLIVGPYDPTDRFTYWPLRFARGGDVAVPDDLDAPVQWIDARDAAAFVVHGIERRLAGDVNVVGPARPAVLRELFDGCLRARDARAVRQVQGDTKTAEDMSTPRDTTAADDGGSGVRVVRVPVGVVDACEVKPWSDLPCWVPRGRGLDGITRVDPTRAIGMGLRHRPLDVTIADTLRWARDARTNVPLKAGLTPEREAQLLAAFSAGSS